MTAEEVNQSIQEGKAGMQDAIDHLQKELIKIRTGKASPAMLDGVMVEYYGNPTPLKQVANLAASDSKTITIQPWEKSMLANIEQAIFSANLGLTPMNDGEFVRINIPPLTEERRIQLVKQAKHLGEEGKISLRNTRHKVMDAIKKAVKEGYPEDAGKKREDEVEKMTHSFGDEIDALIESKETDIMTI
ncbi:MAG: ribosome recycling factor [Saprospiraceae bacterium]|nr:ribosome recycling factor [Saprospiraceae bacterium]